MKKVFLFIFAAVMAVQSFANPYNYAEANFDLDLNMKEMNRELSLSEDQRAILMVTNQSIKKKVARLAKISPEKRQGKLSEVVWENLGTVRAHLTDVQYRKYLTLLNREFNENHLNALLFGYDLAAE